MKVTGRKESTICVSYRALTAFKASGNMSRISGDRLVGAGKWAKNNFRMLNRRG